MRKYFSYYRYTTKLFLLIIPPMLVLSYLISEKMMTIYSNYNALVKTEKSVLISQQIASLIHEIQVERGMSTGYLSSNGLTFSNTLPTQRKKVDLQLKSFKDFMSKFNGMQSSQKIKKISLMLDNISHVRKQVNALSAHSELEIYTHIINLYLEEISSITKKSNNALLLQEMLAYSNFLMAEEKLGIERAIGTDMFNSKKFDKNKHVKIVSCIAQHNVFLNFFLTYANDESVEIYNKKIKAQSFKELKRMEFLLFEAKNLDKYQEDSQHWFDTVSKKINTFKEIHQDIAMNMLNYIESLKSQMYYYLIKVFIINTLMGLGVIVIAFYVSRKLYKENKEQQHALVQQSKLAAMGEMIGSIAHQWRQPLSAVGVLSQEIQLKFQYGSLEKDEMNSLTEELQKYLEYMSKTIDDFRNFFKPSKKKTIFNVLSAIEESLEIVSQQLMHHNVEVKIQTESIYEKENSFEIKGFESEFKQVIINIINNAREAIDEHSKELEIAKKEINIKLIRTHRELVVKISDNGGGIKEDVLSKIFDPYISTKYEQQGTGLGLYMSKLIIERNMSGKLTAKNIPSGAEFEIVLHAN